MDSVQVRLVLDQRYRNPLTGAEFVVPVLTNPRFAAFALPALLRIEVAGAHAATKRRAIWGAVNQPGEEAAAARGSFPLLNRAFRIVERLQGAGDKSISEDDVATKLDVPEAVCAERQKQANDRFGHIEVVLAAIVLLLLVCEGSVIAVLRRMLGGG